MFLNVAIVLALPIIDGESDTTNQQQKENDADDGWMEGQIPGLVVIEGSPQLQIVEHDAVRILWHELTSVSQNAHIRQQRYQPRDQQEPKQTSGRYKLQQ